MKVFSRAFTLREKLLLMVLCLLLLGVFYVQCVDMPVREGIAAAENERASLETELMVVEAKLDRLEKWKTNWTVMQYRDRLALWAVITTAKQK